MILSVICAVDAPVTPRAGVWIEITLNLSMRSLCLVTPRAGVWIEIARNPHAGTERGRSLPVRECGLKYRYPRKKKNANRVTPRAGVWIEIALRSQSGRER